MKLALRPMFSTSRDLDFATVEELTAQTGHAPTAWPLVVTKELMDNSIDACEESGIPPEVNITVAGLAINVTDNGPGISTEDVNRIIDFTNRVSSREAFVDPCRGAQGNALKTLLAIPVVLSQGSTGKVIITSRGQQHTITGIINQVSRTLEFTVENVPVDVKPGTSITVMWPDQASLLLAHSKSDFLQIAEAFTVLNPHLRLTVTWDDMVMLDVQPTAPEWNKWCPKEPTCAHWYTPESFLRLIGAFIAYGERTGHHMTVREFIKLFRGFKGTAVQKLVLKATGMDRTKISELAANGQFDQTRVTSLLEALKANSKPIQAKALGVIGRQHIRQRLEADGGQPRSFKYEVDFTDDPARPRIIEIAFISRANGCRRLITGVNWSPGIGNVFKQIGEESLDSMLRSFGIGMYDPVTIVVHLVSPGVSYCNRGKSEVVIQ